MNVFFALPMMLIPLTHAAQGINFDTQFSQDSLISNNRIIDSPVIIADYIFDSNLSSSVSGAPDLIDGGVDNGYELIMIDGLELTAFNFSAGTGLSLDVSSLVDDDFSIAMYFELDDTGGYVKLMDFSNLGSDTGLYSLNGRANFFSIASSSTVNFNPNQYSQLIWTRDLKGKTDVYVDKVLALSFTSLTATVPSSENLLHFFQDDDETMNLENSTGTVARITVFDKALGLQDVRDFDTRPEITVFRNGFE